MNRIDGEKKLKELFDEARSVADEMYGPEVSLYFGSTSDYQYFTIMKWSEDSSKRRYYASFDKLGEWGENQSEKRNALLTEEDELLEEVEANAS